MFGEWKLIPERRGERLNSMHIETDTEQKLQWKPVKKLENWIFSVINE
jgi:hypothetical protein